MAKKLQHEFVFINLQYYPDNNMQTPGEIKSQRKCFRISRFILN